MHDATRRAGKEMENDGWPRPETSQEDSSRLSCGAETNTRLDQLQEEVPFHGRRAAPPRLGVFIKSPL